MAVIGTNLIQSGGGIAVTEGIAAALSGLAIIPSRNTGQSGQGSPFRPQVWAKPALTSLLVPPAASTAVYSATGVLSVTAQASTLYVFDAVLRASHILSVVKTTHPIQTGANSADHAYNQPNRVTLEIGMSDAMDSYTSGMWNSAGSKSVAAWSILASLKTARVPLTLTTRLGTYTNMIIEDMQAVDDFRTRYALRASIVFSQLITATVATTAVSSRPQTTGATGNGNTPAVTPPAALQSQSEIPSAQYPALSIPALNAAQGVVPNAGSWSSNSLGSLVPGGS